MERQRQPPRGRWGWAGRSAWPPRPQLSGAEDAVPVHRGRATAPGATAIGSGLGALSGCSPSWRFNTDQAARRMLYCWTRPAGFGPDRAVLPTRAPTWVRHRYCRSLARVAAIGRTSLVPGRASSRSPGSEWDRVLRTAGRAKAHVIDPPPRPTTRRFAERGVNRRGIRHLADAPTCWVASGIRVRADQPEVAGRLIERPLRCTRGRTGCSGTPAGRVSRRRAAGHSGRPTHCSDLPPPWRGRAGFTSGFTWAIRARPARTRTYRAAAGRGRSSYQPRCPGLPALPARAL